MQKLGVKSVRRKRVCWKNPTPIVQVTVSRWRRATFRKGTKLEKSAHNLAKFSRSYLLNLRAHARTAG